MNQYTHEWTQREVELLGTATDREVARRIKRSYRAVLKKRHLLRVPAFYQQQHRWTRRELAWLGRLPDAEISRRLNIARNTVAAKRRALG